MHLWGVNIPKFSKIFSFWGPTLYLCTDGGEIWHEILQRIAHVGEKPQYLPLSNLNTGNAAGN